MGIIRFLIGYWTNILIIISIIISVLDGGSCTSDQMKSTNHTDENHSKTVRDIRKRIFQTYNTKLRPVLNYTRPISVRMFVRLLHFRLDPPKNAMDFQAHLRFSWTDECLTWNASEFNGVDRINVRMKEVFYPDIILYNSVEQRNIFLQYNETELILYSDGQIKWRPTVHQSAICEIDLWTWPYDEHNCSLTFVSWSYPGDALVLYIASKSLELQDLWPSLEWEVLGSNCETKIFLPECCPQLFFPQVYFTINLRRRPNAYQYLIHMPTGCALAFNAIALWIQPRKMLRFHLNQLSFLTLLLLSIYLTFTLGTGAYAITKIGQYIGRMLVVSAGCLFWSTIACNFIKTNRYKIPELVVRSILEPAQRWRIVYKEPECSDDEDSFQETGLDYETDPDKIAGEEDRYHATPEFPVNQPIKVNGHNFQLVILVDRFLFIIYLVIIHSLHP